MRTYHKIQTLFDRDETTFKVDRSRVRRPEFLAIDRWVITEKIDGTNIRLDFRNHGAVVDSSGPCLGCGLQPGLEHRPTDECPQAEGYESFAIGGRTEKADIPKPLHAALEQICFQIEDEVRLIMGEYGIQSYTLFGEGYGAKIQKGGGNYRADQGFILFDVLVNDRTWLSTMSMVEAANRLGLNHVPVLGVKTVPEIVDLVRGGYDSVEADAPHFPAEGVIAVPNEPLYNSRGDRVIWKLKTKDFA